MDFFEHQDRARRNTRLLALIFVLAVALIMVAVYAVVVFVFSFQSNTALAPGLKPAASHLWDPVLFAWTVAATLAVIGTGTFYKMSLLAAGGSAVARIFGARLINPDSIIPAERRLLNVVEEMALAAGLPVPSVYLLEEAGINAFAAGFTSRDAIIGVTNGCLNLLSRDELQGVIAHEFSHILNGDMRLNLRLMGILHGILVISLIGYWLFRISAQSSSSRISGSLRRKGGNMLVFILAGISLIIIGYIGVFFARLIKSAVARQREFLADASSIQFTRNPPGLAGALKKIGGFIQGSRISHPSAEEASHLFFADGLRHSFFNLLATHPPLVERIRRIDPAFDGAFPEITALAVMEREPPAADLVERFVRPAPAGGAALAAAQAVKLVGRLDAERLNNVRQWLARLPPAIRLAARQPAGAKALVLAMLLAKDPALRADQLRQLASNLEPEVYAHIQALQPVVENIPPELFLPLMDLATATLKTLPAGELKIFGRRLQELVESDGTITLFEYMAQWIIKAQIKSRLGKITAGWFVSPDLRHWTPAMRVIISTLAYYGKNDADAAAAAFQAAGQKIPFQQDVQLLPRDQCGLQQVDRALTALRPAAGRIKKLLLEACSAGVAHDGKINLGEAELLRAVAAALDCPLPPLLPNEA